MCVFIYLFRFGSMACEYQKQFRLVFVNQENAFDRFDRNIT